MQKSMPYFILQASRCAADHTSIHLPLLINIKIIKKFMCIYYFIGSVGVKIVLYLHFLYTNDNRLQQIKKKHE